jgi:hypothetical protein
MLKGVFLWAIKGPSAQPAKRHIFISDVISNRFGFDTAHCKTNRMLGVDFQDRVTAAGIGISHSAGDLW